MKRLVAFLFSSSLIFSAQAAQAYDFKVCNAMSGGAFVYVHVVVVSGICHDRTPVDVKDGDAPLKYGECRTGSTALGCLINRVGFVRDDGLIFGWSDNIGRAGGTWRVVDGGKVCKETGTDFGIFDRPDDGC